jgi:hypothetical protein
VGASKAQMIERERRWALPAAITTLVAVLLFAVSIVIASSSFGSDGESEFLSKIDNDSGLFMAAQIARGLGATLLMAPLLYLFHAALGRSEQMRSQLLGVVVAGPVFLGVSAVLTGISLQDAASTFLDRGVGGSVDHRDKIAENVIEDASLRNLAGGLGLAGALGFAAAMLYSSLHALRTGLLTRFWGSLGMALGAVSILLFQFTLLWFIYAGLLFAGWVPGGRPPAWAEGEAVPWPPPGGKPDEEPDAEQAETEQTGREQLPGGTSQDLGDRASSGASTRAENDLSGSPRRKRKRRR